MTARAYAALLCLGLALFSVLPAGADDDVTWAPDFAAVAEGLQRRQGLLLVDTHTARQVSAFHLDDEAGEPFRPPLGRHLQLVRIPAGEHAWMSIEVPWYDLPYHMTLEDGRWRFRIRPGVINYGGTLFVGEVRGRRFLDVRLVNRAAEVLRLLRTVHPDLLARYPLHHAALLSDGFLEAAQERVP